MYHQTDFFYSLVSEPLGSIFWTPPATADDDDDAAAADDADEGPCQSSYCARVMNLYQ